LERLTLWRSWRPLFY